VDTTCLAGGVARPLSRPLVINVVKRFLVFEQ
jgi:hypothetical protein